MPFDAEQAEALRETGGTLGLFLLLKGFSSGAVALTGVEAISERRARVPPARVEERGDDARAGWASILGTLFFGISVLAHHLAPVPEPRRDRDLAAGRAGVRRRRRALRVLQFATAAHPHPGRQHRLRRLPAAVVDHRPGRLPPPPARQPRRPARVLERHRRSSPVAAGAAHRRLRRHHQRADPALRGRRVHVVHAVASPAWCATTCASASRAGSAAPSINGVGATATFVVLLIVARHEVHERRLDAARRDPRDRRPVQGDQAPLRRGRRRRSRVEPELQAAPHEPHVVVLVGRVHRGVLEALAYARSLAPEPPGRGDDRVRRARSRSGIEKAVGRVRASTSRSRSSTRRTAS